MEIKIAVVLSNTNPFSVVKTKPVVNAALPYIASSKYVNNIVVISPFTDSPIKSFNNKALNVYLIDQENSKNKKLYYSKVLSYIAQNNIKVVEVHQDLKLAAFIAKANKNIMVSIHKHVPYFINHFREYFSFVNFIYYHRYIKHLKKIYTISNFVKKSLLEKYSKIAQITHTIYNTYGHLDGLADGVTNIKKKKQIIFAGKPVPHKGIEYLIPSLVEVLENHAEYSALLVVANFSDKSKYLKVFKRLISMPQVSSLIQRNRIKIISNVTAKEVFKHMQESSIAVVPSRFSEPFGLVALEASLAKCVVVSSGAGALAEITENYAFYCKHLSVTELTNQINHAINYIKTEAKKGFDITPMATNNYNNCLKKFNINNLVGVLDGHREKKFRGKGNAK